MFAKKISDVQISIWELDFKVAKSRQIREGVRQDRERAVEALQQVTAKLAGTANETDKAALQKEADGFTENVRRYEAQIKMIDEQIVGKPAAGEDPGVEGINDRIRALSELREMYKQYLTTI